MSPVVGVGVDAVDVDRFRRVLGRRPGLPARLFSEASATTPPGRATRPSGWPPASPPRRRS